MLYRSYNKEQKLAVASVLSVFNNIQISRFNKSGTVTKTIRVPATYANASTIVKSIQSSNKVVQLPIITVEKTSLDRDTERVVDLNAPFLFQGSLYPQYEIDNPNISEALRDQRIASYDFRRNPPIPMNIGFTVTFMAAYEEDLNQIIGNVIPFLPPYIVISSYHPYDRSEIIRTKLLFDGKFNMASPEKQETGNIDIFSTTLSLTYAGLFWYGNNGDKFSWDASGIIDSVHLGANGPVGNINEGDVPDGTQYVDVDTGDIYQGTDTGKNINDGDVPGDNEFVDPATGEIYRRDPHLGVGGNINDGFFIAYPNQTIARLDQLIELADSHAELPYHEHIYVDGTSTEIE